MYNQPSPVFPQQQNQFAQPQFSGLPQRPPIFSTGGMTQGSRSASPSGMYANNIGPGAFPPNYGLQHSHSGQLPISGGPIQMQSSNQAYPLTYMQNSPLSHLGYSYPQMFPAMGTGQPGGYGYVQGQGYGYQSGAYNPNPRPLSSGHLSPTGIKSAAQLNYNITDQSPYAIGQGYATTQNKDLLVTSAAGQVSGAGGVAGLPYARSQHVGIQQGFSQIQYIPYESYYIDYEQRQFVQNIQVPIQKKVKDYYAVEHVVDYVPREIQETVVDMVPEEKMSTKLYYVPVQKQVIHLPHEEHLVNKTVGSTTTVTQQQRPVNTITSRQVGEVRQVRNVSPVSGVNLTNRLVQGSTTNAQVVRPPAVVSSGSAVRTQVIPQTTTTTVTSNQQFVGARQEVFQQQQPVRSISPSKPVQLPVQTMAPPPPAMPVSGQFLQSRTTLSKNQAELVNQMNIPDSAKVNYQYSTKQVRTLSPEQIRNLGQQPRTVTGPSIGTVRPPAPAVTQSFNTLSRPQGSMQAPPSVISQPAPVTTATTTSANPTLMKNRQVDLADSEHIDITKSTFHAFYGGVNNSTDQLPLAQGTMTGTNPAVYTNASNSSNFSFAGSTGAANRGSGGFPVIPEGQPNRTSGGSVFDYDQGGSY